MKLQLKTPTWREKRESVRLPLSGEITCRQKEKFTWVRAVPSTSFSAEMVQASMFGLRLLTHVPLRQGDELVLRIRGALVGGSGELKLRGRVVWTESGSDTDALVCGIQLSPHKCDAGVWAGLIRGRVQDLDPTRKFIELDAAG